jgi:hypothetical protein
MRDRQHVAIDDEPDEMHDAVGWRVHTAARRDIDSAVTGRILGGWR